MTGWIVTHVGYQHALDLAYLMDTPRAYEYAQRRRPGALVTGEIPARWITDGWVEPAEGGQLTLF